MVNHWLNITSDQWVICWLVVSNIFYFPFHIWDVTLLIDELICFKMFFFTTNQVWLRANYSRALLVLWTVRIDKSTALHLSQVFHLQLDKTYHTLPYNHIHIHTRKAYIQIHVQTYIIIYYLHIYSYHPLYIIYYLHILSTYIIIYYLHILSSYIYIST